MMYYCICKNGKGKVQYFKALKYETRNKVFHFVMLQLPRKIKSIYNVITQVQWSQKLGVVCGVCFDKRDPARAWFVFERS